MTSIVFLAEAFYCNIFRSNYLRDEKHFPIFFYLYIYLFIYLFFFFLHFRNSYSIFNIFNKKMTLIANVFLNLRIPKNVVRVMSKKTRFRGHMDKLHGKPAETLLKSERKHLYHVHWSLWRKFRLTKIPWVIYKILGLFVNPLTAGNKYSLLNRDKL